MKILKDNTHKDNEGELVTLIENLDDLWVLYNILRPEDKIKGRTTRRVVIRDGTSGERKTMVLAIKIKKIEFHEFTNRLRILGEIYEGPTDLVSTGDHHTFNLEPGMKITLIKNKWYKNDIKRIRKNLSKTNSSSVMMAIAIESGTATLTLLSNYSLNVICEINHNMPGKRYGKQQYTKAINEFYSEIGGIINENLVRTPIKMIICAGPGFYKDAFISHYQEEFSKNKSIPKVPMKALNASSGEVSAIYEILRSKEMSEQKEDIRFAGDEMLMGKFVEHLGKEDGKCTYGLAEIKKAAEAGAIKDLLVCDIMIRNSKSKERQIVEEILNITEKTGGDVHILSTENPAGDQLKSYGKIAAILRYNLNFN